MSLNLEIFSLFRLVGCHFAWSEAEKFLNKVHVICQIFIQTKMRHWQGRSAKIAGDNVYLENGNLNIYTWASNSAKTSKKNHQ